MSSVSETSRGRCINSRVEATRKATSKRSEGCHESTEKSSYLGRDEFISVSAR